MKKITSFIITLIIIYAGILSYFYFGLLPKNKKLSLLYNEAQSLKVKLQNEIAETILRYEALQKENEKLKKESLEYLKQQGDIVRGQEALDKKIKQHIYALKESGKKLRQAQKELQGLRQENLELTDISSLSRDTRVKKQEEKITKLESDLSSAKERLRKQEALLHYNLGVCYTKEKSYDMAIDEYEKVLGLNPDDADTHYNLAILYDDSRKNPKRAVEHYNKYLGLMPEAQDLDEVKEWIERLTPKF